MRTLPVDKTAARISEVEATMDSLVSNNCCQSPNRFRRSSSDGIGAATVCENRSSETMDILAYKLEYNRTVEHEHTTHHARLRTQKTVLDTSTPESFTNAHSSVRLARANWEVEHKQKLIVAENGKMMATMLRILTGTPVREKRVIHKSRNETGIRLETARINLENSKLVERIIKITPLSPSLTMSKLEEHSRTSSVLSKHAQRNTRRSMSPLNLKALTLPPSANANQRWMHEQDTTLRRRRRHKSPSTPHAIQTARAALNLSQSLSQSLLQSHSQSQSQSAGPALWSGDSTLNTVSSSSSNDELGISTNEAVPVVDDDSTDYDGVSEIHDIYGSGETEIHDIYGNDGDDSDDLIVIPQSAEAIWYHDYQGYIENMRSTINSPRFFEHDIKIRAFTDSAFTDTDTEVSRGRGHTTNTNAITKNDVIRRAYTPTRTDKPRPKPQGKPQGTGPKGSGTGTGLTLSDFSIKKMKNKMINRNNTEIISTRRSIRNTGPAKRRGNVRKIVPMCDSNENGLLSQSAD